MAEIKKFTCHIYEMESAEEAYDTFRGDTLRDYGEDVRLEDGTVLHDTYTWDDGSRVPKPDRKDPYG